MASARQLLAWTGVLVAVVGVAAGLIPVSRDGTSCGTGWVGSSAARQADQVGAGQAGVTWTGVTVGSQTPIEDACSAARSSIRLIALPISLIGLVILVVGWLLPVREALADRGPPPAVGGSG